MTNKRKTPLLSSPWRRLGLLTDDAFYTPFTQITLKGETHFLPEYARHRPAVEAIAGGERFEPATHRFVEAALSRRAGDMVHAGTFFGDMLPNFSAACQGAVFAFEPVLENYLLAKLCVEANSLENVLLFNAGLSDRAGGARIDTGAQGEAHRGGAAEISATGQRTTLMTVDMLGLELAAILHFDVEGHELAALCGASATIDRSRPVLLLADNEQACGPFAEERGYRLLRRLPGLDVWRHETDESGDAEFGLEQALRALG